VIPLGDSVASSRRPIVTQSLIGLCVLVFLYELTLRGAALDRFVERWGAEPRLVLAALAGDPRVPRNELVTLFTSQFIHAGFLHIGGNMLFLWVFGRAVEDRLGSALYLIAYLLIGALAGLVQSLVSGPDTVPLIGASGAIAGILGIYFISYPTAWVRVLAPIFFFFWAFDLPAVLVLAFWFVTQFFSGISAITQASRATSNEVAVWAHVAGFLTGAAVAFVLPNQVPRLEGRGGSLAPRRADAPGPARLVSSLADLAAVLLGARLVLRFLGLLGPRTVFAALSGPILAVTQPLVAPFELIVPALRIGSGILEIYTLVAILAVYVLAGLVGQAFVRR
jgi:membrane associated rhomboid family serine protease